jgi:transcriptional regulator with XRE-family HTH domain
MNDMNITEWRTLVGEHVETQRKRKGLSKAAAARAAGVSDTWWRALESGRVVAPTGEETTFSPSGLKATAACRALGWPDDCIERLRAGEPLPDFEPAVDNGTAEMLTLILGEIRNHRTEIAPDAVKIGEIPTREDVERMISAVAESTRQAFVDVVEQVSELASVVVAVRARLEQFEREQLATPTPSSADRPAPRKRSPARRT